MNAGVQIVEAFAGFAGAAEELAAAAVQCGAALGWTSVDPEKLNERLVRYYVTEGVMDRPDRLGRDAVYQFRHLLQLLTARRMQESGTSLATIGAHNLRATTKELLADLRKPPPTAAELLVRSFAADEPTAGAFREAALMSRAPASPAEPRMAAMLSRRNAPRPPVPQPDLAAEVVRLREDFKQGMRTIEELCAQLDELTEAVRLLAERTEGGRTSQSRESE